MTWCISDIFKSCSPSIIYLTGQSTSQNLKLRVTGICNCYKNYRLLFDININVIISVTLPISFHFWSLLKKEAITSSLATILNSVIVTKTLVFFTKERNQITFALTFGLIFTKANYGAGNSPLSFRDIWLKSTLKKKKSHPERYLGPHIICWNLERRVNFKF